MKPAAVAAAIGAPAQAALLLSGLSGQSFHGAEVAPAFAWFATACLLPLQADITEPWTVQRSMVLAALALLTARRCGA